MVILEAERAHIVLDEFEKFIQYFWEETSVIIFVIDCEIVVDGITIFVPKIVARDSKGTFFSATFFDEVDWMLVAQFVEMAINERIAKNR